MIVKRAKKTWSDSRWYRKSMTALENCTTQLNTYDDDHLDSSVCDQHHSGDIWFWFYNGRIWNTSRFVQRKFGWSNRIKDSHIISDPISGQSSVLLNKDENDLSFSIDNSAQVEQLCFFQPTEWHYDLSEQNPTGKI